MYVCFKNYSPNILNVLLYVFMYLLYYDFGIEINMNELFLS